MIVSGQGSQGPLSTHVSVPGKSTNQVYVAGKGTTDQGPVYVTPSVVGPGKGIGSFTHVSPAKIVPGKGNISGQRAFGVHLPGLITVGPIISAPGKDNSVTHVSVPGKSSSRALGTHVSSTMLVADKGTSHSMLATTSEGGRCQSWEAPRVVGASVKGYHEIPEALFNSLPESSVDPPLPSASHCLTSLPPMPTTTTCPAVMPHGVTLTPPALPPKPGHLSQGGVPAAAPSGNTSVSDWSTMLEGRRSLGLLVSFDSDEDTTDFNGSDEDSNGIDPEDGIVSDNDSDKPVYQNNNKSSDQVDNGVQVDDGEMVSLYGNDKRVCQSDKSGDLCRGGVAPTSDKDTIDKDISRISITQDISDKDTRDKDTMDKNNTPAQDTGHGSDKGDGEFVAQHKFRGFCNTMLDGVQTSIPTRSDSVDALPSNKRATTPDRLEEELRRAGVYFRRPGEPRNTPTPPPAGDLGCLPSETENRKSSIREDEKVALKVLEASFAGFRDLSSDDSSVRSHSSSVVEISLDRNEEHGKENPDYKLGAKGELQGKDSSSTERLNLIEEVYVNMPRPPLSSVSMRAYYPSVDYVSARRKSRTATVSTRLSPEAPHNVPHDSDSGHESGATSPCGTLTGEESRTPPPSPPTHTRLEGHPHSRSDSIQSFMGSGVQDRQVGVGVVGESSGLQQRNTMEPTEQPQHFVVVAIDFGTTYSGYAFSFVRDPESIHMMKKWEGGDPGLQNQKTPTIVLLTPEGEFHALGYTARDTYHDLEPKEAQKWLFFDKFKMVLHSDTNLSRNTMLQAANGTKVPALSIFTHALHYFRDHALRELSEQVGMDVNAEDVRWVVTVPAIWTHAAKHFMREAAYGAGMGTPDAPDQLLIALEPEAAAIYCRRLRRHQLMPERPPELRPSRHGTLRDTQSMVDVDIDAPALPDIDRASLSSLPFMSLDTVADWLMEDTVYMVVDCGGGTVDITVYQMTHSSQGLLKEIHKASGGPHGSIGVDTAFSQLLDTIFGSDFMSQFKQQRPAAYVDLMIAFESRKRNASPFKSQPLNIALPFSFIDLYKKIKGKDVESAIKKQSSLGIRWSSQGMLRVEQETMRELFLPTLNGIAQAIEKVLMATEVGAVQYLFLVGGFAESPLVQKHIRDLFSNTVNVIIPQGMGLAILRGAVQFGLDPGVVTVRRSRLTYGIGVLNRFQKDLHPKDKRVVASGMEWCADVLDHFVDLDQSIAVGDIVSRSYTPATDGQTTVTLHLYATDKPNAKFVTDEGVHRIGTLHLHLDKASDQKTVKRREITVNMNFGDTEAKVSAVDQATGRCVKVNVDFLTL